MRNRWFISLLFVVLGALVTARIRAVLHYTQQASAQVPSSAESVCTDQGKAIDVLQYLRPTELDSGQPGKKYEMAGCYVRDGETLPFYDGNMQTIAKTIDNEPTEFFNQTNVAPLPESLAQTGFIFDKNSEDGTGDEWWFYDNEYVYLYEDDSANFVCVDGGDARYREQNTIAGEPIWGGPYRRCANNGDSFTETHRYSSYNKQTDAMCQINWGGNVGQNTGMEQTVTTKIAIAVDSEGNVNPEYPMAPNLNDTIVIELTAGPGAGEKRFYTKGYGLTGYHETKEDEVTFFARANPNGQEICKGSTIRPREKDDQTILPIEGFSEALQAKNYTALATSMAQGGYRAVCVDEFSAGFAYENLERFVELNRGQTISINDIESEETLSAAEGYIGFARSQFEDPSQNASVENFLSVPKGEGNDEFEERIASAPIWDKLEYKKQLAKQELNLRGREFGCSKYVGTPEAECPLMKAQPGAMYDLKETLVMLHTSGLQAADLAEPYEDIAGKTTLDEAGVQVLRRRMAEVPLNFERGVDLNYLVLVKELPKESANSGLDPFGILKPKDDNVTQITDSVTRDDSNQKRDHITAIAFPVPAFGVHTGSGQYKSEWPSWMYQQSLQPASLNQKAEVAEQVRREQLVTNIQRLSNVADDSKERNINPVGKAFQKDGGYDTMTRALTDISDLASISCQQSVAEAAETLKSSTFYGNSENYTTVLGLNLNTNLFSPNSTNSIFEGLVNPLVANTAYLSDAIAGEGAENVRARNSAAIKAIWVTRYPVEEGTDPVGNIKNAFFSQNQLTKLNQDVNDYQLAQASAAQNESDTGSADTGSTVTTNKLLGDITPYKKDFAFEGLYQWSGGERSIPFEDPSSCSTTTDENGNPVQDCTNELKVSVKANAPQYLGGTNQLRNWQEGVVISSLGLWPHNSSKERFAKSVATPEQYFKGDSGNGGNFQSGFQPLPSGTRPISVATFKGGKTITSGEHAVHYCAPNGNQCSDSQIDNGKNVCTLFVRTTHDIPAWKNRNDDAIDCQYMGSYSKIAYPNTLVDNPVNDNGQFVASGDLTACEYVVREAKARGVSPRLALAVWGEETGFGSVGGAFFGYFPTNIDKNWDLAYQLDGFLDMVTNASSYQAFLLRYSEGSSPSGQFCTNPKFPGRVKDFYDFLDPSIDTTTGGRAAPQ